MKQVIFIFLWSIEDIYPNLIAEVRIVLAPVHRMNDLEKRKHIKYINSEVYHNPMFECDMTSISA